MAVAEVFNPADLERASAGLDEEQVVYGAGMLGLIQAVRDAYARAEGPGTPTAKVTYLELAKAALALLERLQSPVLHARLTGHHAVRVRLHGLEQTYRAFGFYRMAGVP